MIENRSDKPETPEDFEAGKSRTQIKREMISLQQTGERLVGLSEEQIKAIHMPDNLRQEIMSAKKIKAHSARKRQIKFIGSLMRKINVEPINDALYEIDRGRGVQASEFHMVETWRDKLVSDSNISPDVIIDEIKDKYPEADRQQLRQLTRNAKKEAKENKPPKSSRALFRYIRKLVEG